MMPPSVMMIIIRIITPAPVIIIITVERVHPVRIPITSVIRIGSVTDVHAPA